MRTVRPGRASPAHARRLGRIVVHGACVLFLAVAAASCSAERSDPPAGKVTVHEDGQGPLSANTRPGGKALLAPAGETNWWASFGTPLLCNTEPGEPIRLTAVRYDSRTDPLEVRTAVRTVPPVAEQTAGDSADWSPFSGLLGRPGDFDNSRVRGRFGDVAGHVVTSACSATDRSFTELVTSLRVPPAGAWVRRTLIDYTVGSHRYTLVIRWEMVGCGSRTAEQCT